MGKMSLEFEWQVLTPDRRPTGKMLIFCPKIRGPESVALSASQVKAALINRGIRPDFAHLAAVGWVTDIKESYGRIDHIAVRMGLRMDGNKIGPVLVMGPEGE